MTAKSVGTAIITVRSTDNSNVYKTCTVTVINEKKLGTIPVLQEEDYWCWAACAEMMGKTAYPASQLTQTDAVKSGFNNDTPNYPLEDNEKVCRAVEYIADDRIAVASTTGNYSFSTVKASIDSGNALILGLNSEIQDPVSGVMGGHMVIIYGYRIAPTGNYVYILNPVNETLLNPDFEGKYYETTECEYGNRYTVMKKGGIKCYKSLMAVIDVCSLGTKPEVQFKAGLCFCFV